MTHPTTTELADLFQLLDRQAPVLRPPCRWLILGPELAAAILADHSRPPVAAELTDLVRLLERRAPDLVPIGLWLVEASAHAAAVRVELQLDRLIAADLGAWQHPTQVLERSRLDLDRMLASCAWRRRQARGERQRHLRQVEAKLERAVQIAASARKRRQKSKKR